MLDSEYPKPSEKRCPNCGKPLIRGEDTLRCHGRCDFGPRPADEVVGAKVWQNVEDNDHTWAFIYYCRRKGDNVQILRSEDKITVVVDEHNEASTSH